MHSLDLYALPRLVPREALADATVIVIDLLRASTTICHALAAGAECVTPYAEIAQTLAAAEKLGRQNVLLGGERHGTLIAGFDLGNSPAEYAPAVVAGRRILFTTTNGARALDHAREARRCLVGAAVNRTAAARAVADSPHVVILCAGTDGEIAPEDVLGGGAIIDALFEQTGAAWRLNPAAEDARRAWRQLEADARAAQTPLADHFAVALRDCRGGANLLEIGHEADLAACAQIDALAVVPQLDRATGELRLP